MISILKRGVSVRKFDRRRFLKTSTCGAYVLGLATVSPLMTRQVFGSVQDDKKIVAKEKWGRIEKVSDGCWAVISTPFDENDFTTVSNGGIIAGKDRVLVVESFMQENGAGWVASWAKKLTGRWPTDIVVTHFHADHSSGANGFFADGEKPTMWLTKLTGEGVKKDVETKNQGVDNEKKISYPEIKTLSGDKATQIDLGGKSVTVTPRQGHTTSDVTIELADPNIVFCGDLFFNRMIPNYKDSLPTRLNQVVATIGQRKDALFVPGHGSIADGKEFEVYREFLSFMESSAKSAFDAGKTAAEAAKGFELSSEFKDWYIFAPTVVPRAMDAWYRDFKKKN